MMSQRHDSAIGNENGRFKEIESKVRRPVFLRYRRKSRRSFDIGDFTDTCTLKDLTSNWLKPSNEEKVLQAEDLTSFDGSSKDFLPTLPRNFGLNRMCLRIESDRPQDVIELEIPRFIEEAKFDKKQVFESLHRSLGHLLGITDYKTNMASFWFLDTLALQVLRYKENLGDHERAVLIGWLTGEMKLIRDRMLSREDFFREMRDMFNRVAEKISRGDTTLSWDHVVRRNVEQEQDVENEMTASLEKKRSSISMESKRRSSGRSLQKGPSKETAARVDRKSVSDSNVENGNSEESEECSEPFSSVDPVATLNIIIESTYDVYGNEFRYALIYAVYVESIPVHTYNLPFLLRAPRPVKLAKPKVEPFDVRLQSKLRKDELGSGKRGDMKSKGVRKVKEESKSKPSNREMPATPPTSLTDEELLLEKRRFILPLIEAKEASLVFETNGSEGVISC